MDSRKEMVLGQLAEWKEALDSRGLPAWGDLPDIELYMDQVIIILTQYLNFIPHEGNNEKLVTSSIINNYVRMKLVPAPVKKKYSKIHLAYLIMICILKQSLNISYIQKLIPIGLSEEEVGYTYASFAEMFKRVSDQFISQAIHSASSHIPDENHAMSSLNMYAMSAAVISGISRQLAESAVDREKHPANKLK